MHSSHWFRRVLAAAAVAVLVAGCADGDDGGLAVDDHAASSDAPLNEADDEPEDALAPEPDGALPPGAAELPPSVEVDADEGLDEPLVVTADLTADQVVPGPGSAGTAGRFEFVAADDDEFCIDLVVVNAPSGPSTAHLHVGAAGESGPVALDLDLDAVRPQTTGSDSRWSDICASADPSFLAGLSASTDAFYVQIYSDGYPDGVVRGQLQASTLFDLVLS